MTNFLTWLDAEQHRLATEYRVALWREIEHTKRIFNTITPDVRDMLIKGLREIQYPTGMKYDGNDGTLEAYKKAPKVNFLAIFEEAVRSIDEN